MKIGAGKIAAAFLVGAAISLPAPAAAQQKLSRQDRRAMALTVEQVAEAIEVTGAEDPLDPITWLSTQPFLEKRDGDKFLRAGIEKATGEVFYQLYLIAQSRAALRPSRATYLLNGEVQEARADRIDFDVNCYRGGCTYYEHALVTLPREAVEEFASCAAPGQDASFRLRIFGDAVEGVDVEMFCTEAAGFLLATDRVLARMTPEGGQ